MNQIKRFTCIAFVMLMILALPFCVPSGALSDEQKELFEEQYFLDDSESTDEIEEDETSWLRWLLPRAKADEKEPFHPLPIDFTKGKRPNPSLFKVEGYEDKSIKVRLETVEDNGVVWRIARIQIVHPSQLRTAIAGSPRSLRYGLVSKMAGEMNAIIAMNGDNMANSPAKTSFEFRMGQKIRAKVNNIKDTLIIDEKGDFHLFTGKTKKKAIAAFEKEGHQIINAFTFGPALVIDGVEQQIPPKYGYNPHGKEPRIALGQMDTLSYIIVLAEGRTEDSQGVTQQEMANFLFRLGAKQAFNLDGGNSAILVYDGDYYQDRSINNERAQSDMIYFATLIDAEE